MTPEQAIDLLDQVTSKFQGNRQDHVLMAQAMEVIRKIHKENKESTMTKKSKVENLE